MFLIDFLDGGGIGIQISSDLIHQSSTSRGNQTYFKSVAGKSCLSLKLFETIYANLEICFSLLVIQTDQGKFTIKFP